jgi:hypothetical protein
MKWLVALVIVGLASTASARVVMTPAIPRTCRTAESWEKVTKCLERFGTPKVEGEVAGAKLVGISSPKFNVPGLYLYRSVGKHWVIAGMFETSGAYDVFKLTKPTIAKHTGYRFDIGTVEQSATEMGGKAVVQQKISVFCSGESYFCTAVTTSCDYLVDGRAHESFRGKLKLEGDLAKVAGDRSRSGAMCVAPDEMQLDFAAMSRLPAIKDPLF